MIDERELREMLERRGAGNISSEKGPCGREVMHFSLLGR